MTWLMNVGGQEKAGEQDEVEGKQLDRHIVMFSVSTWIMATRLIRAPRVAVRGTISSKQAACDFGAAGEDFISRGRAHGGPAQSIPMGESVPTGCSSLVNDGTDDVSMG